MARTVSIGNQDFESIRKNNYFYIDKTDFIREWWESGDSVTLPLRQIYQNRGRKQNKDIVCFKN